VDPGQNEVACSKESIVKEAPYTLVLHAQVETLIGIVLLIVEMNGLIHWDSEIYCRQCAKFIVVKVLGLHRRSSSWF